MWRVGTAVVVTAAVAAALVVVGGLGGQTVAQVERGVEVEWRPAYDLLVLPQDVDVSTEVAGQRLTHANFMSSLEGGITVEQWERIRNVEGVEVAAPIATLGYLRRAAPMYELAGLPEGFYAVEREIWWDSGVERRLAAHVPGDAHPQSLEDLCRAESPLRVYDDEDASDDLLIRTNAEYLATGFQPRSHWTIQGASDCAGLDPGGVFAVYGIDPEQEDRLTGLGGELTAGSHLEAKVGLEPSPRIDQWCSGGRCVPVEAIPLLVNDVGWIRSQTHIRVHRFDVDWEVGELAALSGTCAADHLERGELPGFDPRGEEDDDLPRDCISARAQALVTDADRELAFEGRLPHEDAFLGDIYTHRSGEWHLEEGTVEIGLNYVARPSPIDYETVEPVADGPWIGAVRAVPTGTYGPEPTFRTQLAPDAHPILHYQVVGTFDGDALAHRFSQQSRWLPESTYRPPRAVVRFDDNDHPTDSTALRPTANPLGYILEPPRALTTLRAVIDLTEADAPISAIRIRVGGVGEPGEEAWLRVENTARRIAHATGLQPLVTLGAAPARMLVRVPGMAAADTPGGVEAWRPPRVWSELADADEFLRPPRPARDVEGFGWVEEPWLIQGAAISYLRAGATQHLWLVGALAATAILYLGTLFTSLGLSRLQIVAVRRAVGWPRWRIFTTEMARAATLGLAGGCVGLVAGLAATRTFDLPLSSTLAVAAIPAAVAVAALAALLPAWAIARLPVARVLSGGETSLTTDATPTQSGLGSTLLGVAIAETGRLRTRIALAAVAATVAAASLFAVFTAQREFAGSLQLTVLGQAILVETGPLHTAATALVLTLAVALLTELVWQSVADRRATIGTLRAIGWSRRQIITLHALQGSILGAISAAIGCALAAATFAIITGPTLVIALTAPIVPPAIAAATLIGAIAATSATLPAATNQPATTLKQR